MLFFKKIVVVPFGCFVCWSVCFETYFSPFVCLLRLQFHFCMSVVSCWCPCLRHLHEPNTSINFRQSMLSVHSSMYAYKSSAENQATVRDHMTALKALRCCMLHPFFKGKTARTSRRKCIGQPNHILCQDLVAKNLGGSAPETTLCQDLDFVHEVLTHVTPG